MSRSSTGSAEVPDAPVNGEMTEGELRTERKDSIKNRLQKAFLAIAVSIVVLMSAFSMVYFYFSTKREAVNLSRNKIQLAEVFMETKKGEVASLAQNLAGDRAIQIGLDLESPAKISEYLLSQSSRIGGYYVTVFDKRGEAVADIGKADSEIFNGRKRISSPEQIMLQEAQKGKNIVDAVTLANGLGEPFPAFVAAMPIMRNSQVGGIVMVRFLFADSFEFFSQMSKNIDCEIAVYAAGKPVVRTSDLAISQERYNEVSVMKRGTERISLTGAGLNEYRGIFSNGGEPVAVLHAYQSSYAYLTVFGAAILIYLLMAATIIVVVSVSVLRISNTIIDPIGELLQGVNIVRSGDLSHEIILTVKDEIGRLGAAFNEMRAQLSEKISTIEDMNRGLERTVEERTRTIEDLNSKMRHYLSPQLYASIVGGERDASVTKHYRKKLTVFFSDVVNFTSTTESMEPEDMSELLNSYLDAMAGIAIKYGGTIDKFVGDAIMVFFGDPEFTSDKDHALRAVKMALEMLDRLSELRAEWAKTGVERPLHARIGINTGYCTVGNFGSETKMDYTIIGGNVNLAARYEAAAKPDSILMSHETYVLVKDEIECAEAGTLTLKGIAEPVRAYTPLRHRNAPTGAGFMTMTEDKELVFSNKVVDTKLLTPEEKKSLLISIKEVFASIKDDLGK